MSEAFEKLVVIDQNTHLFDGIGILGRGAFGVVWRALAVGGGEELAIKRSRKKVPGLTKVLPEETRIHQMLSHRNIVRYLGSHEDYDYDYLLLELAQHGNLEEWIDRRGTLSEIEVKFIMHGTLSAQRYLEERKTAHCDIKTRNILVTLGCVVKLGDMGLAVIVPEGGIVQNRRGTRETMSPEMLLNNKFGLKTDSWSQGCIMYRCFAAGTPVVPPGGNPCEVPEVAAKRLMSRPAQLPTGLSDDAELLLRSLLKLDPYARPSATTALKSQFMVNGYLPLSLPPSSLVTRPSVEEIKKYETRDTLRLRNINGLGPNRKDAREMIARVMHSLGMVMNELEVVNVFRTSKGRAGIVFRMKEDFHLPVSPMIKLEGQDALILEKVGSEDARALEPPTRKRLSESKKSPDNRKRPHVCVECNTNILPNQAHLCETCLKTEDLEEAMKYCLCPQCAVQNHMTKDHKTFLSYKAYLWKSRDDLADWKKKKLSDRKEDWKKIREETLKNLDRREAEYDKKFDTLNRMKPTIRPMTGPIKAEFAKAIEAEKKENEKWLKTMPKPQTPQ